MITLLNLFCSICSTVFFFFLMLNTNNLDIELIDFMELIDFSLSYSMVEKWRYKYSEKFIKHYQMKVLDSMTKQKPLAIDVLFNYLTKKCKYHENQVKQFFQDIEIEIYRPFIYGILSK